MTLGELVEWLRWLPDSTVLVKVQAELRIRKPGGITVVMLDFPDPDEPHPAAGNGGRSPDDHPANPCIPPDDQEIP
jgi:hypothetical protein